MNDQNGNSSTSDDTTDRTEQPRDKQGRFLSKSQPTQTEGSQPVDSEYTKMNSLLAKQLGITDKLADYQTRYNPRELFKMLEFMIENTDAKGGKGSDGLPPNQGIAPISPEPSKIDLPGVTFIEKPNLSKDKFNVSFKMNPKDLLKPKQKE